jgi:exopolyphosphatase/guanosine-5'-triphosphate,3'-diphosphate pyrophosphatase
VRLATIDLGSNTVRLLIADVVATGRWQVVEADQRVTRLGEGLAASGRLGEAPAARTSAAVTEYVRRARRRGAERVAIVATSAVREAANGGEFAAALERAAGETITVISGEREASLTLAGVLAGLPEPAEGDTPGAEGDTLVFDIGGGSTEYILARGGAPARRREPAPRRRRPHRASSISRARGAGAIPRAARRSGAPGGRRDPRGDPHGPSRPSGGHGGHRDDPGGARPRSRRPTIRLACRATRSRGRPSRRQLERLGALTVVERAALPCLEPGRADLIVPGTAIVLATLDLVGVDRMVVSDWGLREGILISLCS